MHASWLNQIEIYFSIVQRKVVTPNDFTDLDQQRSGSGPFALEPRALGQTVTTVTRCSTRG